MALPEASANRRLLHRRRFDVQIHARDDGLWEVDAMLDDVKSHDVVLAGRTRAAGLPVHELHLRLVIDAGLNIVDAGSDTRWMPYEGVCDEHGDAYRRLIGLNLGRGFRRAMLERLAGPKGCTHLTDLAGVLPTAVMQALAGIAFSADGKGDEPPFFIDRCHALRRDGQAVRMHYPRWHRSTLHNATKED